MRLRGSARALLIFVLLISLALPVSGCRGSDEDSSPGDASGASGAIAFTGGGEDTRDFQLALEKMLYSYLDAFAATDELLAFDTATSTEDDWVDTYTTAMASILRAEELAAEFDAAVEVLDVPADDSSDDSDADSGDDSDDDARGGTLGSASDTAQRPAAPLFGIESAYALDPDVVGTEIGIQLNYDGVADPSLKTYEGPTQTAFETGLVAEFDSLRGNRDRWKVLADRYGVSVAQMKEHVAEGRSFLQSNLDNDVMYTSEAANIAKAIELGSDVALLAATGPGAAAGGAVVRRIGLRAAIAETAAKEGVIATAVKGAQYATIAIDTYELGTAVTFNEEPGPLLTDVKTGLGALQETYTIGKLLLDPVDTLTDSGNLKTIKGWWDFLTEVPEADRPAGVFEVEGGLVAGSVDPKSIVFGDAEPLSADEMRSLVPPGLDDANPLADYLEEAGSARADSQLVGTYDASFEMQMTGLETLSIPFTFTVDEDGNVSGSWQHSTNLPGVGAAATYATSGSFAGTVADGVMTVSGTSKGTVTGPYNSSSGAGPFTISTPITTDGASGTMTGSDFGYPFTAKKR